ncbi:MAG: efflux RND transporter permease subunit [Acidobacteriota bacterium]
MTSPLGPAGRIAAAFVHSKLTPLLIIASLALGFVSVLLLPREEEPQIVVPMADVMISMPGLSPAEIEQRLTKPFEKILWEIPGVEYLYSTSMPGQALLIVRFLVGEDENASIVNLNQKLAANAALLPPGAFPPLVKLHSIDDVPILALTLHSSQHSPFALRRIAAQLEDTIREADSVSSVTLIGGQRRELRLTLDLEKLNSYRLSPHAILDALQAHNQRFDSGRITHGNTEFLVSAGDFLRSAEHASRLVVDVHNQQPIFLRDVASIADTGTEPSEYVFHLDRSGSQSAVTIAVAKRKGANAITVARDVLRKVERARPRLIPSAVQITTTRQYGETAAEKSNELLEHMAFAVLSVALLIALALGWRESLVVFAAVPVTLALTLTVFYLYGYTLNRITLFALIFSIGILVDDAIVVVENIVRHARLPQNHHLPFPQVVIAAVNEVGNPTILATFTVVAAILPMAFVGGLMGPYMRPIPIGATAAMLFSMLVAFLVTPWAAVKLLAGHAHLHQEGREDLITRLYRRYMHRLLHQPLWTGGFLVSVVLLLIAAMLFFPLGWVKVKMLPFDNKSEFQVIVNMPEGASLEQTQHAVSTLARAALAQPEVLHAQTYAGAAAPHNFNGLVRHYYLRSGANVADIQLNLQSRHDRQQQSHEIAKQVRDRLLPLAQSLGALIQVAEVPPGPPVLATLVAEVYGPSPDGRRRIAAELRTIFARIPGIVDIDWYVEDPQPKYHLAIDTEKAALHGISPLAVAEALRLATAGLPAGLLHQESELEPLPISLRLARADRASLDRIRRIPVAGPTGPPVPLSSLTTVSETREGPYIYHKNLMPVTYVTADVAGRIEAPVYAVLAAGPEIDKFRPEGYAIEQYVATQPFDTSTYSMKWDGEWHITYEVFRDLGLAFAAVLVLIYVLVVGWFESFLTPFVIMVAIPFSLVGILPGHALLGAFFTATSMIGFIAGAGIVVRNSIILVDFIELRLAQGMPLDAAVIDAGAVRFRPMMLTAAAVVVGSAVILFDPIFQGLAIALMAGEIASLLLSRVTVPVVYYFLQNFQRRSI